VTYVALLASLVIVDCALAGFRAAAGRDGRLDKRTYYRAAIARGAAIGVLIVIVHGAVTAAVVESASDPHAAWGACVAASRMLVIVYGAYATCTLAALALFVAPIGQFRVLATVIALGPMTLMRRLVVVGGLVAVAIYGDSRVAPLAAVGGALILPAEALLGRRYTTWRDLA
jgi:hypothetical protein